MRRLRCFATVAGLALVATPASAQEVLEIIPFGGSYLPLVAFGDTRNPVAEFESVYKESIGVLGGVKVRWHLSDRVALQGSASYVRTGWWEEIEYDDPDRRGFGFSLPGSVIHATGELLFRPSRTNVYGSVGGAYVARGGDAWDPLVEGTVYNDSNFAFVGGAGVRAAAIPGLLSFDVSAQVFLYSVEKVEAGFVFAPRDPIENRSFQADLTVTVGIPITLVSR